MAYGVIAVVALRLFESNLRVLSPGAYAQSRWTFGILLLALSPCFLWAVLVTEPVVAGLACALAALFFGMRILELERGRDAAAFAVFAALAISVCYFLWALLVLPAVAVLLELRRRQQWGWLLAGSLLFVAVLWPAFGRWADFSGSNPWQHWSLMHFFRSTFVLGDSTVSYTLPNLAYLFYPLVHPFFCLTLSALFLLFKKTDVHLYAKRVLALSLLIYLVFLGGLPRQDMSNLLPAYSVLLLLFFPAWDRFFAYGLYFFPRLAYALMGLTVVCQVVFGILMSQQH
ncbi:MAG: hypothetical protein IPM98_18525 [Lewinellaceae bacterium]|nr:hypothetical protein [Lewinellaceae bacterium]